MTLLLKALRDVWRHKGAYLACAAIMGLGVGVFASMSQMAGDLERAYNEFYRLSRMADGFARVVGMSRADAEALAKLPGVRDAQGRLTALVSVVTDDGRNASLRLHSYDVQQAGRLCELLVLEGEAPSLRGQTLCMGETYVTANGLKLGDVITIASRGKEYGMTITGITQTPEYIYVTPEGASILPDDTSYGVAYVPLKMMEEILGSPGGANEVVYTLDDGVSFEQIRPEVNSYLKAFGLMSNVARKDQTSVMMLEEEVKGVRTMSSSMPALFLIIGAVMTLVIVKRMVEQQRGQIGLLKTFGYGGWTVVGHYASYGLFIGLMASVMGGAMGTAMAGAFAEQYRAFFHMPGINGDFSPSDFARLGAISLACAVSASGYASRGVLKLPAAEALRPPAPPSGKPILLERAGFLWRALRSTTQLTLRSMFRSRARALTTLLSVAACYTFVAAVFAFYPIFEFLMERELSDVQRFDLKVQMQGVTDASALTRSLTHLSGVSSAEALLELSAQARAGEKSQTLSVLGIETGSVMYRVFDQNDRPMALPQTGVLVNAYTAQKLGLRPGDTLTLEFSYPDKTIALNVAGIAAQYLGATVFVDRALLCKALGMGDAATSATLFTRGGENSAAELADRLNDARGVASVIDAKQAYRSMRKMFEVYMSVFYLMGLIGMLVGFAVLFNASVVTLSERARELMSMRVLGFTRTETAGVINREQLILTLIGSALGVPLARPLLAALSISMTTDAYSLPVLVPALSHILASSCMLGAAALSALMVVRRVSRLSMVEVLKERE